jgi:ABC-type multidrug transport system permease subunit
MLIGSLAQTSKQAGGIGMVAGFGLMLSSGFLSSGIKISGTVAEISFPSEGIIHTISQLTPHSHAVRGYYQLILYGADLTDIVPNILPLLGFAAFFFLVSMWRFKFD